MCHRKGRKTASQESLLEKSKEQNESASAPLGEFEHILEEMEKRGMEPRIRRELKKKP